VNKAVAIRPATADDLESLYQLYCAAFRSQIEQIWGWDEAWQRSNFSRTFESSLTSVVQVAGLAVGYLQTELSSHQLYLRNIALQAEAQGQGIGTLVVRQLQQLAQSRGVPVKLRVFPNNARALQFWKRMGFLTQDQADDHIEMSWSAA
jgi:ribosomal protein S18 acetylase RimI-like enzyme